MGNWLLFYGVDVAGYDFTVDKELQFSGHIAPNSTKANLPFPHVAVSGTSRASNPAMRQRLVKCRLLSYTQCSDSSFTSPAASLKPIDTFCHFLVCPTAA
jgi:hypothetical protein